MTAQPAFELLPGGQLTLALQVSDPEVLAELRRRADPEERARYALAALRVGVLALKSAGGVVDEQALRNAGESLLRDVKSRLDEHRKDVTTELATSLRTYFDRQTGTVPTMVEGLVGPGGRLTALLERHLAGDGSALARTLVSHVGRESPLFRLLSPEQKDGLLHHLQESVRQALEAQRAALLAEFSLDRPESALARLVRHMKEGTSELDKAFRDTIGRLAGEFSLDDDASSLSRFRRQLGEQVGELVKSQTVFQAQVLRDLEGLRARRAAEEASTRKGLTFEAAVGAWLRAEGGRRGESVDDTGARPGELKHCKKGDFVLTLSPDSAAPGERIVVEAKDEAGFTVADVRAEMDLARPNRRAQIGVFVLARAVAPEGTPPFQRLGDDLVVVWDAEEPATDVWLEAALEVARALVVRRARAAAASTASFDGLERTVNQLAKDAATLESISTSAGTARSAAERIADASQALRRKIEAAVEALRSGLLDLRPGA